MEKLYHLINAKQLRPSIIERIFEKAEYYEKYLEKKVSGRIGLSSLEVLKGATVGSLFYEESTRTRWSFEKAAYNLNAKIIGTEDATKFSSAAKGESLEDTIEVISNPTNPHLRYVDIIVLRHKNSEAAERATQVSGVPIINAGCGGEGGEHPTQALLDIYTFKKLLGRLNNFTIAFVGDLRFSRIIRSDVILLSQYPKIKMFFVAPEGLGIKPELKSYLCRKKISFEEPNDIKEIICQSDIGYIVRIQKNRIKDKGLLQTYQRNKNNFAVTKEVYKMSEKIGTFFCHPMPIDDEEREIRPEVKHLPRVKIFEQAGNGVPIRMAVLDEIWQNQLAKSKRKG